MEAYAEDQRGIEIGYSQEDIQREIARERAVAYRGCAERHRTVREHVASEGKVGVIGYCWGGFLSWLSATRLSGSSAATSYYGGGIGNVAHEQPRCPVLTHFGEKDHAIPLSDVEKVRNAHPSGVEIHIYPSGHGFNCDERGSYDAESARTARERTAAFLNRHLR